MRNGHCVEDELFGVDVFHSGGVLSFDDPFEIGNALISGNFDRENFVIFISQDPATDCNVGVKHAK